MDGERRATLLRWTLTGLVALGVGTAGGALAFFSGGEHTATSTAATPTATPFSSPEPLEMPAVFESAAERIVTGSPPASEPSKQSAETPQARSGPSPAEPAKPINAEPVRVHTGDGDCLNVRPQPGTTFATDPYTCLAEGTLLWLTPVGVTADGETWRYALGAGWVAARYTKPTTAPPLRLPAGLSEATVINQVDGRIRMSKVDFASTKESGAQFVQASGSIAVSPDGAAFAAWDGQGWLGATGTGQATPLTDAAMPLTWHVSGKLLARRPDNVIVVVDPADGSSRPITEPGDPIEGLVWAADGRSVYAIKGPPPRPDRTRWDPSGPRPRPRGLRVVVRHALARREPHHQRGRALADQRPRHRNRYYDRLRPITAADEHRRQVRRRLEHGDRLA